MHSLISEHLASTRQAEAKRSASASRQGGKAGRLGARGAIVIRRSQADDTPALTSLAGLDSGRRIQGPALVAEVDGVIRAALALDHNGGVLADPFTATGELVALLELRAAQLRPGRARRAGARPRLAWIAPTALRRTA